jgi:hypothetical protein
MSLLVMATNTPSTIDRLSPSWMRRSISRRSNSPQKADSRPATANGLLAPRPTSRSSNSDESHSPTSSTSGRRGSVREIVQRLRSPSNASIASSKSQETDINEIDNWFYGFRRYNQLVSTTTSPNQTYPSQEFAKVTKALTKNCGGHFHHGLPEAAFDFSLLWSSAGKLSRKENTNEPSWSWTAYDGPVTFPLDPTTCPDIYTMPRSEGEWFRSEVVNFHIGPESAPYTVRREKCNSLRIKYPPYFHAPRGSDASAESNTLRFTALTISADGFDSEQAKYQDKEIACSFLIDESDDKRRHCGVIMDFMDSFAQPSSTGPYEFVLLSRNVRREHSSGIRKAASNIMHPPGTPIWDGERFVWDEVVHDFDDEHFAEGPWKMLNVMLIRWHGEYAERVAIARIHEDAWLKRSPARKDIVLR